ncbi:hypothetical protein AB3S75_001168 [Citrus x aurantiifolia]
MGSQTQPKILVVDLCNENLKPGTSTWISTCNEIRQAMEDTGCFEAIYNKIPLELHNEIFKAADELFDLPIETKMQNTSDKPYHEYFGQYTGIPLYESLAIDDPTNLTATQSFTDRMWPNGNPPFCESVHSFAKIIVEVDQLVMRMIMESYGIEKYYDSHIETSNYLLRFFKYRKPEINEHNVGLYPHTDKNMVSIIHQNHINGLQIKAKDGEWIDLEPSPSSFVIMAADGLLAWSNGRIRSCEHQVIINAYETRYSMGLFSFNRGIVHIPEEFVDELHPLHYRPFDIYEFLRFHDSDEGKKTDGSITSFCGI